VSTIDSCDGMTIISMSSLSASDPFNHGAVNDNIH